MAAPTRTVVVGTKNVTAGSLASVVEKEGREGVADFGHLRLRLANVYNVPPTDVLFSFEDEASELPKLAPRLSKDLPVGQIQLPPGSNSDKPRYFREIFKRAGMKLVHVRKQRNFPDELFQVRMYALVPEDSTSLLAEAVDELEAAEKKSKGKAAGGGDAAPAPAAAAGKGKGKPAGGGS